MTKKVVEGFLDRLSKNPLPVVVDFWAPWCGPCRSIEPGLKRLGQEYAGRVDVWKVNADEQPALLRELRVYGIPTLVVFQGGQEITRRTGAQSPGALQKLFEAALSGKPPVSTGMRLFDRLLRAGSGLALMWLGYFEVASMMGLVLAGLGGLILFSAVHDRCPIWQALSPRLSALFRRND